MNLIGSFHHAPVNTEPMATLKTLLEAINNQHSTAVSSCDYYNKYCLIVVKAALMEASHWRDHCRLIIGDLCKYNVQLISGSLPSECMK